MRILGISTERAETSKIASQILSLGKSIAGKLLGEGAIMPEELEVVEYGIDSLFDNLWGLAVTLMVGFVFRFFWGSFLLWLFVFPLRKYAGGFHAKTKMILSILVDTFISKISLPMQPVPKIGSISGA